MCHRQGLLKHRLKRNCFLDFRNCEFFGSLHVYLLDVIADKFVAECTEDAAEECDEIRPEVPLSKQFNSTAFARYCRWVYPSNIDTSNCQSAQHKNRHIVGLQHFITILIIYNNTDVVDIFVTPVSVCVCSQTSKGHTQFVSYSNRPTVSLGYN